MVDLRGALREPSVTHVAAGEGHAFA
jgi:hypothetical protein